MKWISLIVFPLLCGALEAQEVNCVSNKTEIDALVTELETRVSERIRNLDRKRKSENLNLLASSNLAAQSGARIRENNEKYERLFSELRFERDLAIVQLRSRVTSDCQNGESLERNNNKARGEDLVERLSDLSALHSQGILTDEEFNAAKRRLLGL